MQFLTKHFVTLLWQCVLLVDYYAPLIFKEIAKAQPEPFCEKLNLCEEMLSLHLQKRGDLCKACHDLVAEVLTKLEDPDTQVNFPFFFVLLNFIVSCCIGTRNACQNYRHNLNVIFKPRVVQHINCLPALFFDFSLRVRFSS